MKNKTKNTANFVLTSADFKDGEVLAKKHIYTRCGGDNKSPALSWSGAPADTKSFALTVEDPDAPHGTFIHWVLFDVPNTLTSLPGGVTKDQKLTGTLNDLQQGINGFNETGYDGPCPPSGTHHYIFTLYALNKAAGEEKLEHPVSFEKLMSTIKPYIIAQAKITGLYNAK